jgi:predicted metal-dependent HD superfamily phosphohydrolase
MVSTSAPWISMPAPVTPKDGVGTMGFTSNQLIAKSYYDRNNLAYHNWDHVNDMISRIPKELNNVDKWQKELLIEAIVWHDAIYQPGALNNEERSAELYGSVIMTNPKAMDDYLDLVNHPNKQIINMILSTQHHYPIVAGDMLQEVIIDLDLFGLSLDWPDYINNGKKIFKEFDIGEPHWREPRQKWVEKFLARDKIYQSGFFLNRELRARYNLEKELYLLKNKVPFITQP